MDIRIFIIGLVIGVYWLQQQSDLLPLSRQIVLWVLFVLLFSCAWWVSEKWKNKMHHLEPFMTGSKKNTALKIFQAMMLCVLGITSGWIWASYRAQTQLEQGVPHDFLNKDWVVQGTVVQLPQHFSNGVRFQFVVDKAVPIEHFDEAFGVAALSQSTQTSQTFQLPWKIALAWYGDRGDAKTASRDNVNPHAEKQDEADENANENAVEMSDADEMKYQIKPGQKWQFSVRLKPIHGQANPHGFEYEAWMLEQGVTGLAYVKNAKQAQNAKNLKPQLLKEFEWGFNTSVERVRYDLREKVMRHLGEASRHHLLHNPDKNYQQVISALVLGEQSAIPNAQWKIFNQTGVGHLISISGLHITLVASFFSAALMFVWRRSFFIASWRFQCPILLPTAILGWYANLGFAGMYVALSGFNVPAQRTLWMIAVVVLCKQLNRHVSATTILCWALAVVVLIDPWCVMWPGFWLSFLAVALLLFTSDDGKQYLSLIDEKPSSSTWQSNILKSFWKAAKAQYVISLGLVPISLLLFSQISLVSPIANAVAIPIISFIVTPCSLIAMMLPDALAAYVLGFAHLVMVFLAWFLENLSQWEWATWKLPQPPFAIFSLSMLGMVLLLLTHSWRWKIIGVGILLPLFLYRPESIPHAQARLQTFDVGQGTAVLIETAQHRLLYDTGPRYNLEANSGERVLLPYLNAEGVKQLDAMIISHEDSDHSGGAESLLASLSVKNIYTSFANRYAAYQKPDSLHHFCYAGDRWEWDGVQFEFLHPALGASEQIKTKSNNRSCVLKVSTPRYSVLLTGDIEALSEKEIIHRNQGERTALAAQNLKADVLFVPHHGSGTSSTLSFLKAVQPSLAIIQVGYLNRYKHPKPQVIERYANLQIPVLRTDESGAIQLELGETLQYQAYRKTHRRYWYDMSPNPNPNSNLIKK